MRNLHICKYEFVKAVAVCVFVLFIRICAFASVLDSLFYQSVLQGDGEKAKLYLSKGADINAQDASGATLLHRAALYSNLNVAQWLLDRGADINKQVGNTRITPLMLAAHQQDVPMCQFLVEHRAALSTKDREGKTAADYAYNIGYIALSNYLRNPKTKLQKPYLAELISSAADAFSRYDYNEAIRINKELCKRLKKEIVPDNILYTKGLNDLGMCYMTLGDYAKAKKYIGEAVSLAKKYSPNSNIYYSRCVYYAVPFFNNSEFDEAFNIYMECLQHIEVITDYQMRWTVYNNIGVIATHWGKYDLAEKMLSNAVSLGKSMYDRADSQYAMYAFSLANLGGMYMEQGSSNVQEKAENYLADALGIYSDHNDYGREYAVAYKNYGALMVNIGNYDLALQIYLSFADIVARVFGKEHDEYAYALDAIAGLYIRESKYDDALLLLTEAKHIREANNSMQTPQGASLLINLGDLCERIEIAHPEIKTSAEEYFKEAISILTKTIGYDNLKCAGAINYLSAYYYRYERYQEALELEEKSMKIIESIIGTQNQNYLTFYANKCATYQAQHKWKDALYSWSDFTEYFKLYIKDMFPVLTEEERNRFWNSSFEWRYESMIPSLAHLSNDSTIDVNGFAYDNALFTKGILLTSTEQIQRAILSSGNNDLIKTYKELNSTREELIFIQGGHAGQNVARIDSLQKRIRSLDRYLAQHSREYKADGNTWNYSWKMVQTAMPDKSAALEFLRFNLWDHNEKDSVLYAVLLIDKECISPIYIPLFCEDEILPLVNTSSENLTNYTYSKDGAGTELFELVWGKILPHIRKEENIYFAPSGAIHQLAIEALPFSETMTIADRFNIVRLSSTRALVSNEEYADLKTASLYGGIVYDVDSQELLSKSNAYSSKNLLASRSINGGTINRGSVSYLNGTKREVDNISVLLGENDFRVNVHTATDANEESFKALDGKHQSIIHIATRLFLVRFDGSEKRFFCASFAVGYWKHRSRDNDRPT